MQPARPTDDAPRQPRDVLVVRVLRSGGFAGLRREWTAAPEPEEAPRWQSLIDDCPWDEASEVAPPRGADRFVWRISATCVDEPPRRAELPDAELQGPWRELVDEVRAFDDGSGHTPSPSPGPPPTPR